MSGGHLTVVLHDLWAVIWTTECLELLAFRALHLSQGYLDPAGGNFQPLQRQVYELTGVKHSRPVRFPRDTALLV